MTLRTPLAAILIIAVLTLAGCASDASEDPSTVEVDDAGTIEGSWVLQEGTVDGAGIPLADTPVTMVVDATTVAGDAACNSYTAPFDGSFPVGEVVSTRMMCAEDLMATENAYLEGLRLVDSASIDGDTLTLAGPGVELRFAAG